MKNYSKHWRRKTDRDRNKKLTEFRNKFKKGGCVKCGSMENLQFHHPDPKKKGKEIVRIKNLKKLEEEIKGCVVLCAECHKEVHYSKK